jgi:hypothetical protein
LQQNCPCGFSHENPFILHPILEGICVYHPKEDSFAAKLHFPTWSWKNPFIFHPILGHFGNFFG